MDKTILLTGASGFLGSHLLEALIGYGYRVVILKRSTSDIWRIRHLLERVKSYDLDIVPVDKAFEDQHVDVVIHTACHYGRNDDPIDKVVEANLMFGLRLLEVATLFHVSMFINSDTMLPKDLCHYTRSKKQFVEWLQQRKDKINIVNLKLEHMYGPNDDKTKFIPWIIDQLNQQVAEIKLTKGEQLRDFVYIDDVVSAYLIFLQKNCQNKSFAEFDVGTGTLTSVKDLVESVKALYERKHGKCSTRLIFGALPYRGEIMIVAVDNRALLDLGWAPKIALDNGIQKLCI